MLIQKRIKLKLKNLVKNIEINNKEIEEIYNDRIDEFSEPEKRNVQQIVLNNKKEVV